MPWRVKDMVRIVIPGPPKALARVTPKVLMRQGRAVLDKNGRPIVVSFLPTEVKNNQALIRDYAIRAMGNRPLFDNACEIRIVAYMPIPDSFSKPKRQRALDDQIRPTGRPDADNLMKQVCDALHKTVVWNDMRFTDVALWKRYAERPRLTITVTEFLWVKEAAVSEKPESVLGIAV